MKNPSKHRLLFIKSTVAGKYSFDARIKDDFFQSMFPEASIDKFFCLFIRSKTIFIVLCKATLANKDSTSKETNL